MAVSKTRMNELIRAHDWRAVDAALRDSPALKDHRDERGRNWLHICCMAKPKADSDDAVRTADVLLAHGFGIDEPAFREGEWKATPLWHAIAWNGAVAEFLLQKGCDPNYSFFAAIWNRDLVAIRLLARYGANVDEISDEGETPFLGAIMWSRFAEAQEMLRHGADVNAQDRHGNTALHLMLRKGSDKEHFPMLIAAGARGDFKNKDGKTPAEIMRRKRDPDFRRMAEELVQ